jgi:tetraacyldisaccharide 4'-kinase
MRPPEFWSRNTLPARAIAAALAPLEYVYGATIACKSRLASPWRARAAVICVGNLTVGGSGKTPLVIALARLLRDRSVPVACLSRGYGRAHFGARLVEPHDDVRTVGDEALLLAQIAPTVVSRDRAAGARLAEAQAARLIVMDDGHQNFSLAKDLSIVVVDGETGFGNGKIVPAGPLRESVPQGLSRADAVVIMGDGAPNLSGFAGPVLRARLEAERRLDGRRFVAFAGLGRPEKFFAMLRALGAELATTFAFPDHHVYAPDEILNLRKRAEETKAALITTEKDIVRLAAADRRGVEVLPVHAVFDDPAAVTALLAPVIARVQVAP